MDFFTALESGWRAGRKQFLKRRTELQRDADLSALLAAKHAEGLKYPNPPYLPADAVAELNEIRAILHPDGPETRPAVFQIRGPQDAAS